MAIQNIFKRSKLKFPRANLFICGGAYLFEKMEEHNQFHVHSHETHKEQDKHYFVFTLVTILTIAITLIILLKFDFQGPNLYVILILLAVFYFSIAFLLLEPRFVKEIFHTVTQPAEEIIVERVVEKPVVKEVDRPIFIERPPIIKTVEKEVQVVREVEKPVLKEIERPVYFQIPKSKLDIPRYDFVGSSQTLIYHSRNCRLGKSIKKKYKISHNDPHYFTKHHFSPCQVCIQKIKKV